MTDQIIRKLIHERCRRSTVMPHYTPDGWFECDLFELTEAGYTVEYEVKISRGDFFADSKKHQRRWDRTSNEDRYLYKHDHLEKGLALPNRFYYVAPKGLIQLDEVPVWAGFIEMEMSEYSGHLFEKIVRHAPRLHERKSLLKQALYCTAYHRWISGGRMLIEDSVDWSI